MLSRLVLKDFKSFRDATLQLANFTLIVGANATGKSNVLDALRVLHGIGLGHTLPEVFGGTFRPGGMRQLRGVRGGAQDVVFEDGSSSLLGTLKAFQNGGTSAEPTSGASELTLEITVPWEGAALRHSLTISTRDPTFGPRVVAESLGACTSDAKGWHDVYTSHPYGEPLPAVDDAFRVRLGPDGPADADASTLDLANHAPALSQVVDGYDAASDEVRAACEHLMLVLADMRFLDLDPDAMRESAPPGQTYLGDRGEHLSSVLHVLCEDPDRKAQLLEWVRALTPMDAVDFDFRCDLQGRVLVYLNEASGHATSAVNASDGTLRLLALAAALLSADNGRIYAVEAIDHGIHPTRLHLLIELIETACATQGIQVIATTHNPALLAALGPEALEHAVLAWRPEGAPDTRLRRILDLPDARRVIDESDLAQLHATGWLEDAAAFDDADEEAP